MMLRLGEEATHWSVPATGAPHVPPLPRWDCWEGVVGLRLTTQCIAVLIRRKT